MDQTGTILGIVASYILIPNSQLWHQKKPLHNDISGSQGQFVPNQGTTNLMYHPDDVDMLLYTEINKYILGFRMLNSKTEQE